MIPTPPKEQESRRGRVAVGHPVDVASGAFFGDHLDFERDGTVPLALSRFYSTALLEKEAPYLTAAREYEMQPFGPGWHASWDWRLRQTLDGYVVTNGEGAEFVFTDSKDPARSFAATGRLTAPHQSMELVRLDAYRVRLVRYGMQRESLSHVFVWSQGASRFFLERVERTDDARIELRYDANGFVTGLFQAGEQRLLRLDWERERVAQAILVLPDGSERPIARYFYDHQGVLKEVHDEDGILERYEYDDAFRMVDVSARSGANYVIRYDSKGRCIYVSGAGRYQERHLRYDEHAHTTWVADSHGDTTQYWYNDAGQVLSETSPLKSVQRFEFDDEGRPTVTRRASGGVVTHVYDEAGRTIAILLPDEGKRTYTYDNEHRLISYTDEGGATTHFDYDADHNIVREIEPDGSEWHYTWTPFGECDRVRNPLGYEKAWTFDIYRNRVTESDWHGRIWQGTFNVLGQLLTWTDPLGHTTKYFYDARAELVRIEDPDGRTWQRHVTVGRREEAYERPDGRRTIIHYSVCGLPTEVVDEEGRHTHYQWDTEPGRLIAVTDPSGNVYRMDYDADGHVIRRRTFDRRTILHRWHQGLMRETVDAAGDVVHWEYDAMDRPIRRRSRDGLTEFTYDRAGNVARLAVVPNAGATDPGCVTEFKYDIVGNCVQEIQDGVVVERTFDAFGNNTSLAVPRFNEATRFSFDPNGECIGLERAQVRIGIERDALGREIRRKLPGAGIYEQTYDPCHRILKQALTKEPGATHGIQREIQYDVSGAAKILRDSLHGEQIFFHDGSDQLVGLLRADASGETYLFDASGNRTRRAQAARGRDLLASIPKDERSFAEAAARSGASVEAATFDANRIRQASSIGRTVEYEYDEAGRTVAKAVQTPGGVAVTRFAWNTKGHMISATLPNGDVWRYRYDGLGRRVAKIRPNGTEHRFIWDQYRILYELEWSPSDTPTLTAAWAYVPGSLCPVLKDSGAVEYLLPGLRGVPEEVVGADGKLHHVVRKGIWGERFDGGAARQPAYGQWFDAETGLHYNVFRYYDPESARYLSPDPIGLRGGLNEYAGVPSPVLWDDPLGLAIVCEGNENVWEIKDKFPPGSRESRQLRRFVRAWNRAIQDAGGSMTTRRETAEETAASNRMKRNYRRDQPARFEGKVVGHVPDACAGGPSSGGRVMALDSSVNGSVGGQVGGVPPGQTYHRVRVVRD
ncbi:DUF6531 domain-containing protein [Pendulispora brunnea]|uniref:DUF6531 domain-containing protein n=1 Tax=Pendulispora brunnea TaxID=2905690 RepID=A0ABZ2K7F6_9BACT